MTTDMRDGLDR